MTRRKCIATGLAALSLASPRQVHAGAALTGLATEWTQLLNKAQLVQSYIRQGEELHVKIQQYMDMLKHTATLPQQVYGSIQSDLNQLAGIVQQGRALAYSMANLDQEFRNRFRGYGYNAGRYYVDYRDWSQTSLDTTLSTLRAAGLQGQQLNSEQTVLSQLRVMMQGSDGRLKALQVMGQIAEHQTQQLMKLRQLMIVDLQSKQAFQAAQMQRQMAGEAAAERFFRYNPAVSDGTTFQGGFK